MAFGGLLSCKKENTEKKNNDNLQGKWEVQKELSISYENDVEKNRYEEQYKSGQWLYIFEGNNLTTVYGNGTPDVYTYVLNGENFVMREGNQGKHFNLKFNSNIQIVLSVEDSNTDSKGVKHRYVTVYTLNKK